MFNSCLKRSRWSFHKHRIEALGGHYDGGVALAKIRVISGKSFYSFFGTCAFAPESMKLQDSNRYCGHWQRFSYGSSHNDRKYLEVVGGDSSP